VEDWGSQVEVHSMEERYVHIARAAAVDPLTSQSLICKQGENKLRGTIHSNLTHTDRGPTLAMEGHGDEEEDLRDNSK
jgi:hypothetical protein